MIKLEVFIAIVFENYTLKHDYAVSISNIIIHNLQDLITL